MKLSRTVCPVLPDFKSIKLENEGRLSEDSLVSAPSFT